MLCRLGLPRREERKERKSKETKSSHSYHESICLMSLLVYGCKG